MQLITHFSSDIVSIYVDATYGIYECNLIEDRDGSGLFQLVPISGVSHLSSINCTIYIPYTMDRELDNANPTIFAPTASGSRRQKATKALLWSEEAEEYAYSDNSSGEEREDIDADEVFGMSPWITFGRG